ncbi:MAG: inositol monophosphatase family protein [Bacteroidota bacterium]
MESTNKSIDLDHLDQELQQSIRKAGEFAVKEFRRFSFNQVEFKAENDPFTFVDVSVENMLTEACSRLIPGSGFITEESDDQVSQNEYVWIIDPIDGTTNFTHGVPHFSISLALQKDQKLILGYVYEPVHQEMFRAEKGKGASLNGEPISVSEISSIQSSLIATGFPYANHPWRKEYVSLIMQVMDKANGLRRMGSAALDLAYVACGRYEAYFEYKINPYDVAAGALLVLEAGGMVTDFTGDQDFLFKRKIVSTNGRIQEQLMALIQESDLGRHDVVGNV